MRTCAWITVRTWLYSTLLWLWMNVRSQLVSSFVAHWENFIRKLWFVKSPEDLKFRRLEISLYETCRKHPFCCLVVQIGVAWNVEPWLSNIKSLRNGMQDVGTWQPCWPKEMSMRLHTWCNWSSASEGNLRGTNEKLRTANSDVSRAINLIVCLAEKFHWSYCRTKIDLNF